MFLKLWQKLFSWKTIPHEIKWKQSTTYKKKHKTPSLYLKHFNIFLAGNCWVFCLNLRFYLPPFSFYCLLFFPTNKSYFKQVRLFLNENKAQKCMSSLFWHSWKVLKRLGVKQMLYCRKWRFWNFKMTLCDL